MKTKFYLSCLSVAGLTFIPQTAIAQTYQPTNRIPVADNSQIGTQVLETTNKNFTITGGLNRGQNLFHSFTDFSVPTGGAATFDNSLGKQSIITRVTGGDFSDINGLVNTQGANFFLINPNGIVFGTNAQLNVGQTFVGSTANGIDLVDGGGNTFNFLTNQSKDTQLLTINPNALFNVSRLNMGVGNGQISNFGTLQTTNPNQYIGLIGGNVTLDGGKIIAPGGRVDLGGLNSTGTVNINSTGLVFSGNGLNPSDVTLTNGGLVTVRANQPMGQVNLIFSNEQTLGSSLNINARNVNLINAGTVSGNTLAALDAGLETNSGVQTVAAGDININATGTLIQDNSQIKNTIRPGSQGQIGDIKISTNDLKATNGAQISGVTAGQGNAGSVKITATGNVSFDGTGNSLSSGVNSGVLQNAVGKGGIVEINTRNLSLTNGGQLQAEIRGQGDGGGIKITATGEVYIDGTKDGFISGVYSNINQGGIGKGGIVEINTRNLSVKNGGEIAASTFGQGDAGAVKITAEEDISFDGFTSYGFPSGAFSEVKYEGVGKGGLIEIKARNLSLTNGAELVVSTYRPGDAGIIKINATDKILLDGFGNGVPSGAFSTVHPAAVGNGGGVEINTRDLLVTNGARLFAGTLGQGNAGTVKINATGDIYFDGFNGLPSGAFSTVENGANGKGGGVEINSRNLWVTNGAQLTTSTSGQGNAGNITIKVGGAVNIFSPRNGFPTGLRSEASIGAFGNGGNITVEAGSLSLQDNAALSSSTFGKGDAGNITVKANDSVSLAKGFTQIFSTVEAGGVGKGGNIDIKAGSLSLQDGAHQLGTFTRGASTTQPAGQGDAGNINVKVTGAVDISGTKDGFFSAINSFVATGTVGNGGNITVDTGSLSLRDGTQLQAATLGQGNAGTITVNATDFFTIAGNSGLFVSSQSQTGTAGDIIVTSPKIILDRGILASASLSGNGGNIQIGGKLPAQATSIKEGSQINPAETKLLLLRRDGQITTNAFGTDRQGSNGGNITITAPNGFIVTAPNENSDISANGFSGSGGKVTINTQQNFWISPLSRAELEKQLGTGEPSLLDPSRLPTNDITAISQVNPALNGQVNITPAEIDPSRGLSPLPNSVTDPTNQINPNCSAKAIANNSFTSVGRGGIPATPKDPLNEENITANWVKLNPNDTLPSAPIAATPAPLSKPIVEAQGWRRERNGDIILVAGSSTGILPRQGQSPSGCVGQ